MNINIFSNFLNTNICSTFYNLYKVRAESFKFEEIFSYINKNKNKNNIIFIEKKYLEGELFKKFIQIINKKNNTNLIIPFDFKISDIDPLFMNNKSNLLINKISDQNKIIDINEIIKNYNNSYINSKKWYLSKSPFTTEFEIFLTKKIFEIILLIKGQRKKAIFLDLDDTIWGGTLAEEKYYNLKIGGIDSVGEAFLDFQKLLKKYSETGIILGIISRNYEKIAIEAIKKHPEMHLKITDFAGWKINHKNKSKNIIELAKEINISTDSVVFLDNNYYERIEVKNQIKDITVPELGEDPYNYCSIVKNVTSLSYINLSKEDLLRSKQYFKIRTAENNKKNYKSHAEWLKSIGTQITIEKFSNLNLERYFQMFNKINQINLSSRRLNKADIEKISKTKNNFFLSIRQKDKYADLGIIGIITYCKVYDNIFIKDFLFSCRALGRGTEKTFLKFIIEKIFKNNNIKRISFNYKKTEKNTLLTNLLKDLKVTKDHSLLKTIKKFDIDNSIKIIDKS
jgi:FkbH-like protein